MSNQLVFQYWEAVQRYENELDRIERALPDERAKIDESKRSGLVFYPRHSIVKAAEGIIAARNELDLFDRFTFERKL